MVIAAVYKEYSLKVNPIILQENLKFALQAYIRENFNYPE